MWCMRVNLSAICAVWSLFSGDILWLILSLSSHRTDAHTMDCQCGIFMWSETRINVGVNGKKANIIGKMHYNSILSQLQTQITPYLCIFECQFVSVRVSAVSSWNRVIVDYSPHGIRPIEYGPCQIRPTYSPIRNLAILGLADFVCITTSNSHHSQDGGSVRGG